MQLTINLPNRDKVLADVLEHWEQVLSDPFYQDAEGRIESNSLGQVIMNPPPGVWHGRYEYRIARELEECLKGFCITECPVLTIDGVKGADVGWYSTEKFASLGPESIPQTAPEICVEVISPRNTVAEMTHKRRLYFEAGVIECWQCDLEGRMSYYTDNNVETEHERSQLCPDFPNEIRD